MKFSKTTKIRIAIAVLLFFLFIFANFYAVRVIGRYGAELYLYDKLLVAYQFAGMDGLKAELKNVLSQDKMPHELAVAKDFQKNLEKTKNPDKFLKNAVADRKNKINFLINLRNIAFGFILIALLLRILINRCSKSGE